MAFCSTCSYWVESSDLLKFDDGEAKHKWGASKKADKAVNEAKEFLSNRESAPAAATPKSPSGSKSPKDKTATTMKNTPKTPRVKEPAQPKISPPASDSIMPEEISILKKKAIVATAAFDRPQRRASVSSDAAPAAPDRRKSAGSSDSLSKKKKKTKARRSDLSDESGSEDSDENFPGARIASVPIRSPRASSQSNKKEKKSKEEPESSNNSAEAVEAPLTKTQEVSVTEDADTIAQRRPKRAASATFASPGDSKTKRKSSSSVSDVPEASSGVVEQPKDEQKNEGDEDLHATTEHPASAVAMDITASAPRKLSRSVKRKRGSDVSKEAEADAGTVVENSEQNLTLEQKEPAETLPDGDDLPSAKRPKHEEVKEVGAAPSETVSVEGTVQITTETSQIVPHVATSEVDAVSQEMLPIPNSTDIGGTKLDGVSSDDMNHAEEPAEVEDGSDQPTRGARGGRAASTNRNVRSGRGKRGSARGKSATITETATDAPEQEPASASSAMDVVKPAEDFKEEEHMDAMQVDAAPPKDAEEPSEPSVKLSEPSITTSGDIEQKSMSPVETESKRDIGDEILEESSDPVRVVDTAVDQVMSAISDNDIDGAIGLLSLFDPEASLNGDGKSRLAQILRSVTTETLDLSRLPRLSNELRFHNNPGVKSLSAKLYHRYKTMFDEEYQALESLSS
jgi:hypothetical protein